MDSNNLFPHEIANIAFHVEDIEFELQYQSALIQWIEDTIVSENNTLGELNFIFCSDAYLHEINVSYLNHDTYTDVITFPYATDKVEGDIYISVERIKENAQTFQQTFESELHRVMIHGVLHLLGYHDKIPNDKKIMTDKENEYLQKLPS